MPLFASKPADAAAAWEPPAADSTLALGDEHRLPETSPKPTFTLGLDR